ncbi:MAG: AAA family ATPase [Anaerolineae bacterium]|nr:MAG: AAA family ATPase [Anaerolineae bacterium]
MKRLEIRFLGGLNLTLDQRAITRLGTQKARALFAYLVMHAGQALSREQLAALLWGDFPDERARHSLRQAVHTLRQAVAPYLDVEADSIAFAAGSNYWLDVKEFLALTAQFSIESLMAATDLYRGEFLAGLVVKDSLAFEEWLFYERDRLERQYLAALGQLSDALAASGDLGRAIEYATRLVSHDPLQEHAHRQLMRLYHQSGNRNAALRQYQECKDILWRELGAEPEPETTALYQRILQADAAADRAIPLDARSRYRLKEILGRGSSGIVRAAHDILLNRPVALKVLTSVADDPKAAQELFDAARRLSRLAHPNIASIYDAGYLGETPYVAIQPAVGKPLAELAPLPLPDLLDVMEQVVSALGYAHQHDILHGDVRPANIFVSADGMAQIVGYTLVPLHISPDISLKDAAYFPPELAQGQPPDHRADFYSLGVTLYELTTGHLPFTGQTPLAIISQHADVQPVPPRSHCPDLPPALEAAILRLLAKHPQDRYATAEAVSADLQRIRHQLQGQALIEQVTAPTTEAPSVSLLDRIARGRLINRERELEELKAHWERAMAGQPHLVLLSGEPGIGKTRLARELTVYTRLQGAAALWGRCYEQEVAVPYRPFTNALQGYITSQPEDTLRRQVGTSAAELVRIIPALEQKLGTVAPAPPLNRPEERLRLFDGAATFLQNIAGEKPVFLFLDDLHWADEASLLLLQHLARHIRHIPLLILGAYREMELTRKHPLQRALVELNQERLATRLPLRRLDRQAVGDMIQAMCAAEQVVPAFVDVIYHETEGNPFFVEEVIKALVEEDALYLDRTPSLDRDLQGLRIPQSVRATISRRVERVSPACARLVTQATVIGRRFSLDLLLAITDLDEEAALDALDEAVAAQLIQSPVSGTDETFAFQHTLIAQTLYEELNVRRRARLHGQVGRAIERIHADELDNWVEELAHHFAQAYSTEDEEKAIVYNIRAGDRARAVYAHEEALRYYRLALDLLEGRTDDRRQGDVWQAIGDISYLISRYDSALKAYQNALPDFAADAMSRAALQRKMGLVHDRRGDYAQALRLLEEAHLAIYQAGAGDASHESALVWASQADIYFRLGKLQRAREACLAGLSRLKHTTHYAQLAFLYRTLGSISTREGKTEEGLRHHKQSLDLARRANDMEGMVAALCNLGIATRLAGEWDQAISWGQEGLSLANKVGDYRGMSFAYRVLGTTFWRQGHLDDAAAYVTRGLGIAETIQDRDHAAQLYAYLAAIYADTGAQYIPRAWEHLAQAETIAHDLSSSALQVLISVIRAELYLHEEDWDQALMALSQAPQVEDAAPWLKSDYYRRLAVAYLGKGDVETALSHARQALEIATGHGQPYEIATAEQTLAGALVQFGQREAARTHFDSAIASLETLGSHRELARAKERYMKTLSQEIPS